MQDYNIITMQNIHFTIYHKKLKREYELSSIDFELQEVTFKYGVKDHLRSAKFDEVELYCDKPEELRKI